VVLAACSLCHPNCLAGPAAFKWREIVATIGTRSIIITTPPLSLSLLLSLYVSLSCDDDPFLLFPPSPPYYHDYFLKKGSGGHTALWCAAQSGYEGVVKLLLEAGADPTIADDDEVTPLDIAIYKCYEHCAVILEVRRRGRKDRNRSNIVVVAEVVVVVVTIIIVVIVVVVVVVVIVVVVVVRHEDLIRCLFPPFLPPPSSSSSYHYYYDHYRCALSSIIR